MRQNRKLGAWVTGLISMAAITVVAATFMANASPYVDVQQAMHTSGRDLHLVGTIVLPTVQSNLRSNSLSFTLKDLKGQTINVNYTGDAIENVAEAKEVVAVGSVKNGVFEAHQLLIKCPSKYQDSKSKSYSKAYPS